MKMSNQIASLIEKHHKFMGYEVILQRGNYNINTGKIKNLVLRFKALYDLVLFLSILYVGLRVDYTSCDTVLLADILKSSAVTATVDGTFEIEFTNYWLE